MFFSYFKKVFRVKLIELKYLSTGAEILPTLTIMYFLLFLFQLVITKDKFMTNVLNVLKFEADKDLKKLRHPVDKDKWSTEPAVANAFYSPNKNDIGIVV